MFSIIFICLILHLQFLIIKNCCFSTSFLICSHPDAFSSICVLNTYFILLGSAPVGPALVNLSSLEHVHLLHLLLSLDCLTQLAPVILSGSWYRIHSSQLHPHSPVVAVWILPLWLLTAPIYCYSCPSFPASASLALSTFWPRDSNDFEPWVSWFWNICICLLSFLISPPHILNSCCSEGVLMPSSISQWLYLILLSKVSIPQNALEISFFVF